MPLLRPKRSFCNLLPIKRGSSPVIQRALVSRNVNFKTPSRPLIKAQLLCSGNYYTVSVLINSGTDANLLDMTLTSQLGIGRIALEEHIRATALDGHLLCRVTHQSTPLPMIVLGNHNETLAFHLIHSPQQPVILGYPWLKRHNPHIDCASGTILQ